MPSHRGERRRPPPKMGGQGKGSCSDKNKLGHLPWAPYLTSNHCPQPCHQSCPTLLHQYPECPPPSPLPLLTSLPLASALRPSSCLPPPQHRHWEDYRHWFMAPLPQHPPPKPSEDRCSICSLQRLQCLLSTPGSKCTPALMLCLV